ncbi:HAD family hydrolase [Pseudooceanicola nanhaiensis]|uniref:HAD family hydrolase n=1 Tax=Pseudooceanicola nanhaiensis TaxID=375761 RepID=UPI001CD4DEDE|nr:HAD-IA family hydrolase [Pseudooceanicola nanhaiensis]MCA0920418.1 HAD-IA family hydrolase [Pseudooceanicola nanhaiensis]
MTELICFDCDGVLVDSEVIATRTLVNCFAAMGVTTSVAEAGALFTGKSAEATRSIAQDRFGLELTPAFYALYDRLLYQRFRGQLRPVPGIAEVIAALSLPHCVTSNSGHARLELSLGLTGLARCFRDRVFSAEDVARGKPAPDLFFHAAARMGTDASRCTVIDDSVSGIAGAVAAGARAIGFTGGSHVDAGHAARLREAGACCIADSAAALAGLLRARAA